MADFEVGQKFDSWEEFKEIKEKYSQQRNIQFCTVNSRTVSQANKNVSDGQSLYAARFRYSYIKLGCKHFGAGRKCGCGVRPNQRLVC